MFSVGQALAVSTVNIFSTICLLVYGFEMAIHLLSLRLVIIRIVQYHHVFI